VFLKLPVRSSNVTFSARLGSYAYAKPATTSPDSGSGTSARSREECKESKQKGVQAIIFWSKRGYSRHRSTHARCVQRYSIEFKSRRVHATFIYLSRHVPYTEAMLDLPPFHIACRIAHAGK
jgi:hypothetical protein